MFKRTQPADMSPPKIPQNLTHQANSSTVLLGVPFQQVLSKDSNNLHPSGSKITAKFLRQLIKSLRTITPFHTSCPLCSNFLQPSH